MSAKCHAALSTRPDPRNGASSPPFVPSFISVCRDLVALTKHAQAFRILPDPVDGPVEVGRLAVRREDFGVEEVAHRPLEHGSIRLSVSGHLPHAAAPALVRRSGKHTVRTTPTRMSPKLNVCCVARAVFSAADSSAHGTCPSSLNGVTAGRRRVLEGVVVPRLCCVA